AGAFRFVKVSRVKPKGVSVLYIANHVESDANGTITKARVALGCMADRPVRSREAELALVDSTLPEECIAPADAEVSQAINPPTYAVASELYRREVLPVHFRRLLLR